VQADLTAVNKIGFKVEVGYRQGFIMLQFIFFQLFFEIVGR
jgi:hypothetical protein